MTTKHTPGPWRAKPAEGSAWVVMEGDAVIARLSRNDYPERNKTNARLIAAAPELLETLQVMLAKGEQLNAAFYGVGTRKAMIAAMDGQRDLLDAARAAITKARGEQ